MAMSFSSVFVVSNALRLRFFAPKHGAASPAAAPAQPPAAAITQAEAAPAVLQPQADAPAQTTPTTGGNVMKKIVHVEGMMCQNCVKHVTRALQGVPGVQDVAVSLEDKRAAVTADASVTDAALTAAVTEEGYEVTGVETDEG